MTTSGTTISRAGIYWLASMLMLTQLPHVTHLPAWVSAAGIGLILGKMCYTRSFGRYFPPYVLVGLAVIAALGVRLHYGYLLGRDPGVAFLFLLISLKFAETRQRRDVTLLICLAGFLLFTQYFYSQTLIAALVSLPAVFAMGGSLYVLRDYSHNPGVRPVVLLIAKLLLQGVPLAIALFLLFPRLSSPLWSLPDDARSVSGLSDSMSPGSISNLSLSDAVAFRVEFDGEPPAKQDRYWRGPVFNEFDGRTWRASGNASPIQPPHSPLRRLDYTVTLEANHNRWLFALDVAASLPHPAAQSGMAYDPLATLHHDLQLIAKKPVTTTLRYEQSSYVTDRYPGVRPTGAVTSPLPQNNRRALAFAQSLRNTHADDRALVAAILQWFNTQAFYYTLTPSLLGDAPIDEFLFDSREGFCEHYAGAFVYLLRAASIPARIVTGYQGGTMNGDYLIVRQSDAHAWAEAWIDGHWQRFDPTAAVAPERVLSGMASALSDSEPVPWLARMDGGWLQAAQLRWDAINHRWRKHVVNFGLENQLSFFRNMGMPAPQPWQIVSLIAVIAGIWAAMMLKVRAGGFSNLSEAERLWARFVAKMRDAGLPYNAAHGPTTVSLMAGERFPKQAEKIQEITHLFIALQYTQASADPTQQRSLLSRLRRKVRLFNPLYTTR